MSCPETTFNTLDAAAVPSLLVQRDGRGRLFVWNETATMSVTDPSSATETDTRLLGGLLAAAEGLEAEQASITTAATAARALYEQCLTALSP